MIDCISSIRMNVFFLCLTVSFFQSCLHKDKSHDSLEKNVNNSRNKCFIYFIFSLLRTKKLIVTDSRANCVEAFK